MNNKGSSNWPLVLAVIAIVLFNTFAVYWLIPAPVQAIPGNLSDEIASKVVIPASINTTKIDEIYAETFADSNWKTEAKNLATTEWTERKFKDVYDALMSYTYEVNTSTTIGNVTTWAMVTHQTYLMDDKNDISKVIVVDDSIGSFDATEKDASVWQKIKVYFEDLTGETVKVYFEVDTEITEGNVDDQTFTLA